MRVRVTAAVSFCAISAGLTLGGCQASGSVTGSASAGPAGSAPATSAPATSAPAASAPAASASAASSPAAPAATGSSAPSAVAAGGNARCTLANLQVALGAKSGTTQVMQVVDLTNTSSQTCTLEGFPGVNLVGVVGSNHAYQWPLTRSSAKYSMVTLAPGATAHFDLNYLPGSANDPAVGNTDINVTSVLITPPNDTTHATISWSQLVLLQDAATHPGTWITPVTSGA